MFKVIGAELQRQLEIGLGQRPGLAASGGASVYGKCMGQKIN